MLKAKNFSIKIYFLIFLGLQCVVETDQNKPAPVKLAECKANVSHVCIVINCADFFWTDCGYCTAAKIQWHDNTICECFMCEEDMCNSVIDKLNKDKTEPPKPVVIVEPPPPKPPSTVNFAFGKYYGNQFLIIFMLIVGLWVGLHLQTGIGNRIKNI